MATALFVLLVLAAYYPATKGAFFSDDFVYVLGNDTLQTVPLSQPWRFFLERTNPYEYLPLRDLSYRLDWALFGDDPTGYHVHNLLLYALGCLAAWFACRAVLRLSSARSPTDPNPGTRNPRRRDVQWACALATAIFAAHPAHVESVAWISGRKDLLSGLFTLAALGLFASALESRIPRYGRVLGSYLLFSCALLSKATALPLAAVTGLLAGPRIVEDLRARRQTTAARTAFAAAGMVVMAALFLVLFLKTGSQTGVRPDSPMLSAGGSYADSSKAALMILGRLVTVAIAPVNLRLIYDLPSGAAATATAWLGALMTLAALVGSASFIQRRSIAGVGIAVFFLFSLPFLQLVPFKTWSIVSERFLFLPLFGLALSFAALFLTVSPKRRSRWWIGVLPALLLLLLCRTTPDWASSSVLAERAAERSPASTMAVDTFVDAVLLPEGRFDEARNAAEEVGSPLGRRIIETKTRLEESLSIGLTEEAVSSARELALLLASEAPPRAHMVIGELHERDGNWPEACRHYSLAERNSRTRMDLDAARDELARIRSNFYPVLQQLQAKVQSDPTDIEALDELANLEMELFILDRAISRYREMSRLLPDSAAVHYNLGLAYLRSGDHRRAADEIQQAIDRGLDTATAWNNLGIARKYEGKSNDALFAFERAIELDPGDCNAPINLGRLRLAHGDFDGARASFLRAGANACGEDVAAFLEALRGELEFRASR